MSRPHAILLYSYDRSWAFQKTTEALAHACTRLGIEPLVRDSFDLRTAWGVFDSLRDEEATAAFEAATARQFDTLIRDCGIEAVMGLDLSWLQLPDLFVEHAGIRRIYSLWFDDLRSWARAHSSGIFPARRHTLPQVIGHSKVRHCFYGEAMAREARMFGYHRQLLSRLAAPEEFLALSHPCTIRDRLAFVGNPGFRGPPGAKALELMDAGADLPALRAASRDELMGDITSTSGQWAQAGREFCDLMAAATAAKAATPAIAALEILELVGGSFPLAYEALNASGKVLDAATMVRLVLRYDRPALARRLQREGLADIVSNPDEWEVYGVKALPSVINAGLTSTYMRYLAHVNAANPLRDAPANEKLFEIAACARTSINLHSPDVAECYNEGEVVFVRSLEEAVAAARRLIADPDHALSCGKRARLRTAREHTWDHRLRHIFAETWSAAPAAPAAAAA